MNTGTEVLPEIAGVVLEAGRIADDDYERAVAAALADADAVVVAHCVCNKCDKVIGTVSRTCRGLLFTSKVTAFDVWPQLPERHRQALARQPITYVVQGLLDHPDADRHDRPRAGCAKHGERRVDADDLLARVRAARIGKTIRVVLGNV